MGAAREVTGAARHAAYAAGRAACVAHVAEHNLGAAAYAINAARASSPEDADLAGRLECAWQRERLPDAIRALVVEDQRRRNDICWGCSSSRQSDARRVRGMPVADRHLAEQRRSSGQPTLRHESAISGFGRLGK
jgi:hypothetical protein